MEPFRKLRSRYVSFPNENVDTDQITPARFLKTTRKTGLKDVLFYDWRFDAEGKPRPDFVLNRPEAQQAAILLAGNNFGCGSSREHSPWALRDFGFRALVSTSFADIFKNNCLKNGILPVEVDKETHGKLFRMHAEDPAAELVIDLESQRVILPDGQETGFAIDPFSKKCLLEGIDQLGYLLSHSAAIERYEAG